MCAKEEKCIWEQGKVRKMGQRKKENQMLGFLGDLQVSSHMRPADIAMSQLSLSCVKHMGL